MPNLRAVPAHRTDSLPVVPYSARNRRVSQLYLRSLTFDIRVQSVFKNKT